ncbi:hypothetical protein Tco_1190484 [Tanacetum coccineum]
MDYQLACDREQQLACELFGYREDSNEAAFVVAAMEKIYAHESLNFNDTCDREQPLDGMVFFVDARLRYGLPRDSPQKVVGSQEYQVVCTRPDMASTGVDMLDGFDRGLQTNV